jgi:hypothetical protein
MRMLKLWIEVVGVKKDIKEDLIRILKDYKEYKD